MLMPSIFSRDFMDDLFDMPQRTYAKSYSANVLMISRSPRKDLR